MALMVKRAGADEYGTRIKVLLCGDPGAGKTRMSSTFPDVIYANAEAGLMSVVDRQPAFVTITGTEQLNELRQNLQQTPTAREKLLGVPVQTVVIDTLDAVQRMLVAERLVDQKKDAMAIADWGWLGDQLRAIVRSYRNLDMHVVFTCHIRTVEDNESGMTFVKPALQGAMQDEIAQYVDVAALLRAHPTSKLVNGESRKVLTRVLQTAPDSRHPWLKDRSGKLPMELEINLTNDFARIYREIFPAGEVAPPSASIEPASAPAPGTAKAAREAAKRPAQPPAAPSAEAPAAPPAAAVVAAPDITPQEIPEPELEVPSPEVGIVREAEEALLEGPGEVDQHPLNGNGSAAQALEAPQEVAVATAERPTCEECGEAIESSDQLELGLIRFRKQLCRTHFVAMKTAKR